MSKRQDAASLFEQGRLPAKRLELSRRIVACIFPLYPCLKAPHARFVGVSRAVADWLVVIVLAWTFVRAGVWFSLRAARIAFETWRRGAA